MHTHLPIAEWASIFHERSNPWKLMALLRAYLDESGIDAASPVVAVGGYATTGEIWGDIEGEWIAELNRFQEQGFPIKAFHSTECEHGEGDFFGIQKEIRQFFPPRLAAIMPKHDHLSIWSTLIKGDWDAVVTDDFRKAYPHPFYFCFEHCAREMALWSERVAGGSPVALIYSEQKEFEKKVQTIWGAYDKAKVIAPLRSFGTASFSPLPTNSCHFAHRI